MVGFSNVNATGDPGIEMTVAGNRRMLWCKPGGIALWDDAKANTDWEIDTGGASIKMRGITSFEPYQDTGNPAIVWRFDGHVCGIVMTAIGLQGWVDGKLKWEVIP